MEVCTDQQSYPLQVLIDLREQIVDCATRNLATARSQLRDAESAAHAVFRELGEVKNALAALYDERDVSVSAAQLQRCGAFEVRLRDKVQSCEQKYTRALEKIRDCEVDVDRRQHEVAGAQRELRAVQRSRDAWSAEMLDSKRRKAESELDELASVRSAARRTDE